MVFESYSSQHPRARNRPGPATAPPAVVSHRELELSVVGVLGRARAFRASVRIWCCPKMLSRHQAVLARRSALIQRTALMGMCVVVGFVWLKMA